MSFPLALPVLADGRLSAARVDVESVARLAVLSGMTPRARRIRLGIRDARVGLKEAVGVRHLDLMAPVAHLGALVTGEAHLLTCVHRVRAVGRSEVERVRNATPVTFRAVVGGMAHRTGS